MVQNPLDCVLAVSRHLLIVDPEYGRTIVPGNIEIYVPRYGQLDDESFELRVGKIDVILTGKDHRIVC